MGKTATGALAVLARLSQGGVDLFTAVIGQLMCQDFKLGVAGQRRLLKTLNELQCHSTFGNVLHFGFGLDSIVRNLSATYEGGILVLLSAALAEVYDETYAANILWELTQLHKPVDTSQGKPSLVQWLALVRQCNGILATDEFPAVVDQLIRLQADNEFQKDASRERSTPESMAEALLAIGKVSTGQLESIKITGAADICWLAVMADRYLNLKINVYGADGESSMRNFERHERAQVEFLYHLESQMLDGKGKEIEVSDRLYCLRSASQWLGYPDDEEPGPSTLYGRLPWESALSLTFGSSFDRLIHSASRFGQAIGASARLFDLVAKMENGVHEDTAESCTTYSDSGRGQGFISFAIMTLPELSVLQPHINMDSAASLEQTLDAYEADMKELRAICNCSVCQHGNRRAIRDYCLVFLVETIIFLVRSMSGIVAPERLRPTRAGIEWYYKRQVSIHNQKDNTRLQDEISRYGQMAFILDLPFTEDKQSHDDNDILEQSFAVRRLLYAAKLFSGREIQRTGYERSVISVAGICVYLSILVDVTDDLEALGQCRVIPGRLEFEGRSYDYAQDLGDGLPAGEDYRQRRGVESVDYDTLSLRKGTYGSFSLVAQPAFHCLQVGFLTKHSLSGSCLIGPARLSTFILRASGLVFCTHPFRGHLNRQISEDDKKEDILIDGTTVWTFQGSLPSRMVRIHSVPSAIWRHQECRDCCFVAAISNGRRCNGIIL